MWRKLSFIAFFLSLVPMLLMYFHLHPFGSAIPDLFYILGIFLFGFLGFVFSIISIFSNSTMKNDRGREKILVFHLGMILVFFGIVTRLLFWPFTNYFYVLGLLFIGLSFLFKSKKNVEDNDILDG